MIILFILSSIQAEANNELNFSYGFLGQLASDPKTIVILDDQAVLKTNDKVRINIGYQKQSDFLVIYKGSQGEFMLLYPDGENTVNSDTIPDTLFTTALPWSSLDDPIGEETFYLINSLTELVNLKKLLKRYDKAPEKGKQKLSKKLQDQLNALDPNSKADLSSIASRLDKPLVGGVAFRGEDDETLKDQSITHECKGTGGLAFKKIVINHK